MKGLAKNVRLIWKLGTKWTPIAAAFVLVCAVWILRSRVTDEPATLIGLGGIVLIGIIALLMQITAGVEQLVEKRADPGELHELVDCQKALVERLESAPRRRIAELNTKGIEIDHLGLDLAQAWQKIKELVDAKPALPLRIRILMITGDPARVRSWPLRARDWSESANVHLKRILTEVQELIAKRESAGGALMIEIKSYEQLPVVHGFAIPDDTMFVALCRPQASEQHSTAPRSWNYDWGPQSYRIIDTNSSATDRDLGVVFENTFSYLWEAASEAVVLCQTRKSAEADGAAIARIERGSPPGAGKPGQEDDRDQQAG